MDTRTVAVLAAGIIVSLLLLFVDKYLAGVAIIIVAAIAMSLRIMQDTSFRPLVEARLREDSKAVILTNIGNAPALSIHVALVPLNIEYDVPSIPEEQSHEYPLASMVTDIKVVLTYKNEKEERFSHAKNLSSSGEYDPFKPMIPIFGWK